MYIRLYILHVIQEFIEGTLTCKIDCQTANEGPTVYEKIKSVVQKGLLELCYVRN